MAAETALYKYTAGSSLVEEEHFKQGFRKGAEFARAEMEAENKCACCPALAKVYTNKPGSFITYNASEGRPFVHACPKIPEEKWGLIPLGGACPYCGEKP